MATCSVCGERPVRYPRRSECVNCYSRRYYAENKEKVASRRSRYKRSLRHSAGDRTAEMPQFDMNKAITYSAAHHRVDFWRGRAANYECAACATPAREWAYRGDSPHEQRGLVPGFGSKGQRDVGWSPNPLDYDPLCRSCHVSRDQALAKGR